jgi:hypothetical protein
MKFRDVLMELGVKVAPANHRHSRPGWTNFDCPYCGAGTQKFHMGFNEFRGSLNCWRCGRHKILETLELITRRSPKELRKALSQVERPKWVKPSVAGRLQMPAGVASLQPAHISYLESRGFIPGDLAGLWDIQGIGIASTLQWRLFIPIHHRGEAVSWTTRSLTQKSRYVSAKPEQEAISHKSLLYGEDYCRHAIIVHEGPTDVWRTGPGAVCTFGTAYTMAQVKRIAKYPVRAICFDSSPDAQRAAETLCDDLEGFPGKTLVVVLDADDPGSASPEETRRLRRVILKNDA